MVLCKHSQTILHSDMLTYREEGGVRGSLSRTEQHRVTLKEQIAKSDRKGRWLS